MDELKLIARFGIDDIDGSDDGAVKARARARVITSIAASSGISVQRLRGPARRNASGRRPLGVRLVIAAMLGALAIALAVPVVFTGGATSSAVAALISLAETAGAGRAWESPTPNQLIYTRSSGLSPVCEEDSCDLVRFERESWIAPDGSGRILELRGDEGFDESYGPGELAFQDLHESLGTGPGHAARLRRHVEELAGVEGADDFTMFVLIAKLMGETQLLPEARIDLFEIVASLPDTELFGTMTDELGRSGIAIGYSRRGLRYEVIYDEETALVLEQRVVKTHQTGRSTPLEVSPGQWLVPGSRWTYETSGLVGTSTERL